jgi:hypothetical protein
MTLMDTAGSTENLPDNPQLETLPASQADKVDREEQIGNLSMRPAGATGPRTALGKARSKRNRVKFGIFCSVALLPGESAIEFKKLLVGLLLRLNVPEAAHADRLLRYQVTLERAADRVLVQLERHQRMRLGLFVPPPIRVNLSAE